MFGAVENGMAQSTAQLTVSLNVQPSIGLVFQNNASVGSVGFCPLTNAGTNNVGLDLGAASAQGGSDSLTCVAFSYPGPGHSQYMVASAFDVWVTKSNSSSANYRLAAQISSVPPGNVTWMVNNVALNNSSFTALDASDAYNTAITKTLQVEVKNNVTAGQMTETITFLATAN
jgi:hypothetical protein